MEEEQAEEEEGKGAAEWVGVEAERLLLFSSALIATALHIFIISPKKDWALDVRIFPRRK